MLQPPITPHLFPYTTLFRSCRNPKSRRTRRPAAQCLCRDRRIPLRHHQPDLPALSVDRPERQDRKSTRLNSSHTVISYAVFCLKKKNSNFFSDKLVLTSVTP